MLRILGRIQRIAPFPSLRGRRLGCKVDEIGLSICDREQYILGSRPEIFLALIPKASEMRHAMFCIGYHDGKATRVND